MCYGMGCSNESPETGTCRNPRRCVINQTVDEVSIMRKKTIFYCPECEAAGQRRYLESDISVLVCPDCGSHYTSETLREAYEGDYRNLLSDAEWIRDSMIARIDELTRRAA